MNYLIKGGEFNNKGAEAMTLIAIKNIYERDSMANIYMLYPEGYCPFEFVKPIHFLYFPDYFFDSLFEKVTFRRIYSSLKDFVKLFVPSKKSFFMKDREVRRILKSIDIAIDISGFQLGDQWGETTARSYCRWIQVLKKYGAKVYLMPQSFGAFSFCDETIKYITDSLKMVDLIFAREKTGYHSLFDLGLENIELCNDSVLLEKDFDPALVIRDINKYIEEIKIKEKHNVGLIPNARLFDKGQANKDLLITFYKTVISEGLESGDHCYYLLAHAGEDLSICKEIKKYFSDDQNVILVDHVLYSFNYENFASKLDYIVASRFHSIVHAYKRGTPAVIIGWSVKYNEIALRLKQQDYIVDISNLNEGIRLCHKMDQNYQNERSIINGALNDIQSVDCYSFLNGK